MKDSSILRHFAESDSFNCDAGFACRHHLFRLMIALNPGPEGTRKRRTATGRCSLFSGEVIETRHDYQNSHGIDLMVMRAYGHSKIRRFIVGSNTTMIISSS
ncbi:MAG: universal stress protein [Chlorobiaceae bacterium]|nr:universal stress protein [Chlorobiaceae bacterium]